MLTNYDNWKTANPSHYEEDSPAECQRCGDDFAADEATDDLCGGCVESLNLLAEDDDMSDLFGVDMMGAATHQGGGR